MAGSINFLIFYTVFLGMIFFLEGQIGLSMLGSYGVENSVVSNAQHPNNPNPNNNYLPIGYISTNQIAEQQSENLKPLSAFDGFIHITSSYPLLQIILVAPFVLVVSYIGLCIVRGVAPV